MKRINEVLAGLPATLIAGAALVLKLLLQYAAKVQPPLWCDPAWIAVFITGVPLLYLAVWRIVHNPGISKISSALLICMGMAACIGMTLLGGHDELFAAGEVGFIMSIGAILEDRTTAHARSGLKQLISMKPAQGRRVADGIEETVPIEAIRVGDVLRILPGETIPADGEILSGETSVDQSIMTGESLPVDKEPGDAVFCGTINRFGAVDVRATRINADSSLQRLIRLVEEADRQKAPIARLADRAASWLVPAALVIAVIAWLLTGEISRGVTVLVVFCPCALVLATPTAVMAAIGQATKQGVVIKSGEALEALAKVDTIAFDKTGTLTRGQLAVSDVVPIDSTFSQERLLLLAASAEQRSAHPLAKAICAHVRSQGFSLPDVQNFSMRAGQGVTATVESHALCCGSERFLIACGIIIPEKAQKELEALRGQGKALVLVGVDGILAGIVALADALREEARDVVEALNGLGLETALLTGDHALAGEFLAKRAGIALARTELLPEDKVACLRTMQAEGRRVCMVGDGVNDAPALKAATVGVAMGGMGCDIAVEAADVVLMRDDISQLPYLKRLADATVRTIKGAIALSMGINFAAIALSVAGVLTPTLGALWHNAGSCLVVLLAALLYDRRFDA